METSSCIACALTPPKTIQSLRDILSCLEWMVLALLRISATKAVSFMPSGKLRCAASVAVQTVVMPQKSLLCMNAKNKR
eukprot:4261279-Amphidinium_carterae.1